MGIRRVAGLALNWLMMRVGNGTGDGGSMEASLLTECAWSLDAAKLLNSLRNKTQILERLQIASDVDGATSAEEDDVERIEIS